MEYTTEQAAAIFAPNNQNQAIVARAGTGKTTVAAARINHLIGRGTPPGEILALTFTRAGGKELQNRVKEPLGFAGTLHAFALRTMGIDPLNVLSEAEETELYKDILSAAAMKTVSPGQFKSAMTTPIIPIGDVGLLYRTAKTRLANMGKTTFDFVLQDFYAELKAGRLLDGFRGFTVLVDEAQDTSAIDAAIYRELSSAGSGNLIAIGDPFQCQPENTMVTLSDGTEKPIQTLTCADTVKAFDRHAGRITNGHKIQIASRDFAGDLLTVKTDSGETQCTPNHKWLIRWADRGVKKWVTYLMYRNDRGYRVGWCQLFTSQASLHFFVRCRIEKAEKGWILGVHDNPTAASVEESVIALENRIPTMPFQPVNGANHITEAAIAEVFRRTSEFTFENVLLRQFGRQAAHPFYNADAKRSRTTFMELAACNLIPDLHAIPKKTDGWEPIQNIDRKPFAGKVYSLNVEKHHSYIADGLVTLNSIYAFRGATPRFLKRVMRTGQNTPLTISFRCKSAITEAARRLLPEGHLFEAHQEGGAVFTGDWPTEREQEDFLISQALTYQQDGYSVAILARYNATVSAVRRAFASAGIRIAPRIGRQATPMAAKMAGFLRAYIDGNQAEILRAHPNPEVFAARWPNVREYWQRLATTHTTAEVFRVSFVPAEWLEMVALGDRSPQETLARLVIGSTARPDDGTGIHVETIHGAKGREWDCVILAGADETLDSDKDKQAANLVYVAATRAKREFTATFARECAARFGDHVERRAPSRLIAQLTGSTL